MADLGINDLVPISYTSQISSMEHMEVSVTTEWVSWPNHDSIYNKTVSFNNVGLVVSGALFFPDQYTTWIALQYQPGLVSEEEKSPLLSGQGDMFRCIM